MNKTVLFCLVVAVFCATFSATEAKEGKLVSLKTLGGESVARACNEAQCDADCKNINWEGGMCIDGDCYCYKWE